MTRVAKGAVLVGLLLVAAQLQARLKTLGPYV